MAAITLIRSPLPAAEFRDFLPLLYLTAAVIVGSVLLVLVSRWRKGTAAALSPDASDQLAQYRTLYEQGAISEEEYKKLRSLLGGELRKKFEVPAPAAAPPPDAEPPASPIRPA